MKATVFSMASSKGGSGKTIVTASFATLLSALGKRVLIIDTDAATNGLSLFYIDRVTTEMEKSDTCPRGLFESVSTPKELHFIELSNNLYLLPATYEFRNTEATDPSAYKVVLEELIHRNRSSFDFIFLDVQAGSDAFAEVAVSKTVSDQVIIVSEYDPMSAAGVERLKALFRDDLTYRRTWILLNKMLPDFIKSFRDFMEIAKYLSPLPWSAEVVKAYAQRALPLDLEVGNEYTVAIVQTLRSVLDEGTRIELEIWLEDRAVQLRNPVLSQLEEARDELSALRARRARLRKRGQLARVLAANVAILAGVLGGFVFYLVTRSTLDHSAFFGFGLTAILSVVGTAFARVYSTFRSSYADDDLEDEIEYAEARMRKLRDLSDLELDELVRKGRSS